MKVKRYILVVAVSALLAPLVVLHADDDSAPISRENKIKAAFLYNFMNFVDWPEDKIADANQPIVMGLIGSRDTLKALEPLNQKTIKCRKITIRYFPEYEKLEKSNGTGDYQWNRKMQMLKGCHALLFCTCHSKPIHNIKQIIEALKGSPILTVGETDGFLESGGMINFLMKEEKIRFEINNTAAKKAKLRISSKLLRLAERVVEERKSNGAGDRQ